MPVSVVVGDLTRLPVDAIVNAANTALAPGGGVCGAIFAAAGYGELDRACRAIGGCSTGQAVLTPGFALPAKYIIHTAGPIWHGGRARGRAKLLRSCYDTSLRLAWDQGCRSIAFPLISAGIYGYPKQEALEIALDAMARFAQDHPMDITLAVLDPGIADLAEAHPPEGKGEPSVPIEVVAALLLRGEKFLACQRPAHKARGLLWEFVGGKVEPGETKPQALVRECQEELGVTVSVDRPVLELTHAYPDLTIHLTLFAASLTGEEPQRLEHADLRWMTWQEAQSHPFCPADQEILAQLGQIGPFGKG